MNSNLIIIPKQRVVLDCIFTYLYRVFHNLWTLLQEVISWVFVIKKVHVNMFPILDSYGVMGIF